MNPTDDELFELLSLDLKVFDNGTKVYSNKNGKRHRTHGPAVVTKLGSYHWYHNGQFHRKNGPARYIIGLGTHEYWLEGVLIGIVKNLDKVNEKCLISYGADWSNEVVLDRYEFNKFLKSRGIISL